MSKQAEIRQEMERAIEWLNRLEAEDASLDDIRHAERLVDRLNEAYWAAAR